MSFLQHCVIVKIKLIIFLHNVTKKMNIIKYTVSDLTTLVLNEY